jgi:hypothetical protein
VLRQAGFVVEQVLDLSRHTGNMVHEFSMAFQQQQDAILAHYGAVFLAQMADVLSQIASIYQAHVGYIVVAAQKSEGLI